ncbi:hypothetical protein DXG03_008781 [Asterophora parasitica]|uniref:CCHC-type domain-containing protein n=1 Tax=Asterophora parasitica TaxID=117018 RepID=A0A9P7G406_9AGAR|nr:hypothetical protein DXG03_008781 [Asterophora parasitica]
MEAVLVHQGYWDLLEDDVDLEKLEESEGKAMKKKMAEARVSMILRVEDLQLIHMTNWNPKVVWDTLAKPAGDAKEEDTSNSALAAFSSKKGVSVTCYYCGLTGHYISDCPTRICHFKLANKKIASTAIVIG